MSMNNERLKPILEGALMAAGRPLSIDQMLSLFLDEEQPTRDEIRSALAQLSEDCEARGVTLQEVASGFRFQVKADYAQWVTRLWEEKPTRYSRAVLETLALIAYRQPITRSEIEDIRGVSVSSNIVKSLLEREWIKVVGHRDVPGKPALFATTRNFLDYFNLKGLSDLPPLAEIRSIESIEHELDFGEKRAEGESAEGQASAESEGQVDLVEGEDNLAAERIEIPELDLEGRDQQAPVEAEAEAEADADDSNQDQDQDQQPVTVH